MVHAQGLLNLSNPTCKKLLNLSNSVAQTQQLSRSDSLSLICSQERQRLQSPPGARPAGLRLSVPNDEGAR